MATTELKAQKRAEFGTKKADVLRGKGFIPAELYGHETKNAHLTVGVKEFAEVYKKAGENTIVNVMVDGENYPSLIYDVMYAPIGGQILSVDFYKVNMNQEIHTTVPLEFVGEAPAVKAFGGILTKAMNEIEIKALPADIPASIKIDLSALTEIGKKIYVKDLAHTGKFKILIAETNVVASVAEQEKEEEIPVAAPDISAIKTEGEEKKAERDAAKEEAAPGAKTPSQK